MIYNYMYVGLSYEQIVCLNALAKLCGPNTPMLKVNFGSLKQSADYNFCLEFLMLPLLGRLKPTCDTRIIPFHVYSAVWTLATGVN